MGAYDDLMPQSRGGGAYGDLVPSRRSEAPDYDMAAATAAGVKADASGHWPDTYKLPNHITFSNESVYHGKDGNEGGQWQQRPDNTWSFTPGATNLKNHSIAELQDYFKRNERGNELILPRQVADVSRETSDVSQAEIERASRPAQMTMTRRGQPVLDGVTQAPQRPSELALDAPGAAQPGTAGYIAQGAPSGIEAAVRMGIGALKATGGAVGVGAGAIKDVATGNHDVKGIAARVREGISDAATLPPPIFAPTAPLEEAVGHGFEAARNHTGEALELTEQLRGALAEKVVPEWAKEYVRARPELARTLGEAGFDLTMLGLPAFQALKGARAAGVASAARAAAADDARFANARDVTPQPAPPGTLSLAPPDGVNFDHANTQPSRPVAPAGERVNSGLAQPDRAQGDGLPGRGIVSGSEGRVQSTDQAPATPLEGLPTAVNVPGVGSVEFGPHQPAHDAARAYAAKAGIDYQPPTTYAKLDEDRARRIAQAFEDMPHAPDNPIVKRAYDALAKETVAQFQHIKETGLKIDFIKPGDADPYAMSPRLAIMDVKNNNHLWVFPTDSGFGTGPEAARAMKNNPMLRDSGETINGMPLKVNDVFRIVHDYFSHIQHGVGFRAEGEENAYRAHHALFTPLARRALATETRGQNSWLNYGPHGEKNRHAKSESTVFADQKIGLLPQWAVDEGVRDVKRPNLKVFTSARDGEPRSRADKLLHKFMANEAMRRGFANVDEMLRRDPRAAQDAANKYHDIENVRATGAMTDAYDGFKQITGKYPWQMPFEQFYKHTISRVKAAMPGKPPQWYQNVLRSEWTKAKNAAGEYATGTVSTQMGGEKNYNVIRQHVMQEIETAKTQLPKFKVFVESLAQKLDGYPMLAEIKSLDGAMDKATSDYKLKPQPWKALKDLVRGTIVLNFPREVSAAVGHHSDLHEIVDSQNLYKDNSPGYKGGKDVFRIGDANAELQFNTPEMMGAKEHAHPLYEVQRSISRALLREDRDMTPHEVKVNAAIEARMNEIYADAQKANAAREKAGDRLSVVEMESTVKYLTARGHALGKAEAAPFFAMLKNSASEIGRSDAGLGALNRRGGEVSDANQPRAGSDSTGMPSQSQKDLPMNESLASNLDAGGNKTVRDAINAGEMKPPRAPIEGAITPARLQSVGAADMGFHSRSALNAITVLSKEERQTMAIALQELVADRAIIPSMIDAVTSFFKYSDDYSHYAASIWPHFNVIGIRDYTLQTANKNWETFKGLLAHELTHLLDYDSNLGEPPTTAEESRAGSNYMSARSKRFELAVEPSESEGLLNVTATGDIVREIFSAFRTSPLIRQLFSYPLNYLIDDRFSAKQGSYEMFAQLGSLYGSHPDLVRDLMPKSFKLMESVYGKSGEDATAPKSIGEARARLRQALQNDHADVTDARSLVGADDRGSRRQAVGSGTVRGPPGARVGEGVGVDQVRAANGPAGTGNGGSLNAGNTNGQWDVNEPGVVDNIIRLLQNNKIDLHRVQDEIERVAGTLPDDANPRLAEEVFKGRVRTRVVQFHKNAVEPMLKAIAHAPSKITVQDVGDYLWARHTPERNAQMDKINPDYHGHDLAGMTDAEAAKVLADFRAAGKTGDLKQVATMVDAIIASTQARLVRDGLESQSTIDTWNQTYKHYVPLMRESEETGTGLGFKVKGPESRRALGSTKEAIAIVAAVIAQGERAIVRAEKANVGRQLIKMAEDHPNPDFWRVDTPPTKRVVNKSTGLVETIIDPLYKNREDVFVVKDKVGGKVVERVLAFNPKSERAVRLAKAMQNLDVVQLGAVTRIVGRVTRLMANLATSWNPQFWVTNLARDVQTAAVNLQATPLRGHSPQVMASIPKAQAGILSAEFRNGTGKWAQLYRDFEADGGKMGFMSSFDDLVERNRAIASLIADSQRSNLNPVKWAKVAADVIDKTNSIVENGTRLSIYAEAVKMGISRKQAASIAKNATVNFDRKGNQSSAIGAWYMFFNAQFQGTAILMKSIAKSHRVQAFVGAMVAFAAAMELINRMIGDSERDEAGTNPYELIPEFTRQNSAIFLLPKGDKGTPVKDANGNVVANYVSLPLPYGFSIFHNAGRMMMESALSNSKLVDEKATALDRAMNFGNALLQNFGPLGGSSTPLQYFAPTVAKPFVQQAENKTWFGAPIHPEPQPFGKPKPKSADYFRSTSDTAKDIAKFLSDQTGGDDVKGGALDVHPGNIEHVFSTITGGTGKFGLGMFDFTKHVIGRATGDAAPDDMPWKSVPFVGKFYGDVDERDIAQKYYRLSKPAQEAFKQYVEYKKTGERDKADALEAEHPELIDMGKEITSRRHKSDMKHLREDFKAADELPRSERPKERRNLRREESAIMNEAIRAYNDGVVEKRGEK